MADPAAMPLASAAAATTWQSLPPEVRDQVQDLFTDTLAVIAAGLSHPDYGTFYPSLIRGSGEATVPGIEHGVPPDTAAQINGGATTVLQLQDGHRLGRGHPASHLVPALLALAEDTGAGAHDVLASMVAGYEAGTRVGIAMNGLNSALHDTGTWSTIATAVAAAHLLSDGDADVIATAIETAAATAPMLFRDLPVEGAGAHHLYIGFGSVTGLTAARAAHAGMTALPGTVERYFGPRAGAAFEETLLTGGLSATGEWAVYECLNAYFKVHPTCAHLHGANDAMTALMAKHDLSPDKVSAIEIASYGAGLAFDNPAPETALAARFSMTASTAILLCCGALTEATLTDASLKDAVVRDVMTRIRVVHDPALDEHYPAGRPARVTAALTDGSTVSESVTFPRGDHTHPLSREDRRAKAERLLGRRFHPKDADAVLATIDAYYSGGPIQDLSMALRAAARADGLA